MFGFNKNTAMKHNKFLTRSISKTARAPVAALAAAGAKHQGGALSMGGLSDFDNILSLSKQNTTICSSNIQAIQNY